MKDCILFLQKALVNPEHNSQNQSQDQLMVDDQAVSD